MKKLGLLLLILMLGGGAYAQTKSIRGIYKDNPKKNANVMRIKMPGWVIRAGVNTGGGMVNGAGEVLGMVRPITNNIKRVRLLMVSSMLSEKTTEKYKQVDAELGRKKYNKLVYVRAEGTHVNILFRQKKKKKRTIIKDILVIVKTGEEQLIIGSMKVRWTDKIWKKFDFSELMDGDILDMLPFGGEDEEITEEDDNTSEM